MILLDTNDYHIIQEINFKWIVLNYRRLSGDPIFNHLKTKDFILIEKLIIWNRNSAYAGINEDDKHILPYSMSKYDRYDLGKRKKEKKKKGKLKRKSF